MLVFTNRVVIPLSDRGAAVGENYDRLSYGLCVFCSPGECQNGYDEYLAMKNSSDEPTQSVADINLTKRFTLPYLTDFTTMEEFAHLGVTRDECLAGSLVALVPFVYLVVWQAHFLAVAKTFHEAGKFANKQA